ncbi:GMC family oxidoreductase [Bradyrhizobium arachidis]|uniref:Dehydrogenase n=1 Tax=Bradyrhizobium arachidis TaxID=858423 RepID=A0AAE7TKV7_9BRAD|nr:GMC family oxidoreductase N-terminal domain-containing protein [Bradyrhizobium arachidis]QOZ72772.1 dehydrogenase [Bradyrhizobium arachidis]SFU38697.1 choline dehydrogenase/4-pyridoxate dehydrogenase [Bradyrhizobium arachidis]
MVTYSHIIVGAGSAGCTLASRLTEDPDTRVLLLEAGGWDRDLHIHVPLLWPRMFLKQRNDWGFFTEPEASMGGRPIEFARGKVIGGSSSTNAMAYVRGHRSDYDRWASAGLLDWSYAHVLPYFRRQESWEGGADAWRGGDGPLTTRFCRYQDPLVDAFMAAGEAAGHPATPDYNGAQQEGFGRWQSTIRGGRRCSAAVAYLRPALRRGRIDIVTGARASSMIFEGRRAVGVEYLHGGRTQTAHADREIILAAGVIGSPHLLMLSGIGDPDVLQRHDIPVRMTLRGVGRNLQDHISAPVAYARRGAGPLHRRMRADRIAIDLVRQQLFGTGIASDLPAAAMAFLNTGVGGNVPDVQFMFVALPMTAGPYFSPVVQPYADGFSCRVVLLRPESRGLLDLVSRDPLTAPRIVGNYLATDHDRIVLRQGLRLARDVGHQLAMKPFIAAELAPGPDSWSDSGLDAHIATTGITVHHPLGTCRMGPESDGMAVVDSELRVHGVENLRVADASVMPDLIGGNINAAVIMIAEKASDVLRGRPVLAPTPGC